jgi:hypothetical protein
MGRAYYINGESLVRVKFGLHALNSPFFTATSLSYAYPIYELGLTTDEIKLQFNFKHIDQKYSEWGDVIPPDVMWNISDVIITMNLIHFDDIVYDFCFAESMGGAVVSSPAGVDPLNFYKAGTALSPFGSMIGNNVQLGQSGCHFISLNILSEQEGKPWRFPSAYLIGPNFPLGTKTSVTQAQWRAIPYSPYTLTQSTINDVLISGVNGPVVLWDHTLDT